MNIRTYVDRDAMGRAAAAHAARALRDAIERRGGVRIIAATGASQFGFLDALCASPAIDWSRVELFHLDEYIGMSIDHPASFRRYLMERLITRTGIGRVHLLDGRVIRSRSPIAPGGILPRRQSTWPSWGLARTAIWPSTIRRQTSSRRDPYLIVTLDAACRRQQVGEGWFASIDDVPSEALSMSVTQILQALEILCIVPDARKAEAVKGAAEGEVTPMLPASILQKHARTTLYLDQDSAALLAPSTRGAILAGDA